ncbi:MAG: peptidyl-prolyl cis-trans isomerase [Nevskia sp.]|nr:peptidyl-prolyl cis-trans isomerase [Nevskia sp.]
MRPRRLGLPGAFAALLLGACVSACSLFAPAPEPTPRVLLQTSMGDIIVQLDREHAPRSVDNFLRYVRERHYDGSLIHRVVPGFVIQGGGYDVALQEKPAHAPIPLEAGNGLSNLRGTLGMARDEAPDSATAEFYINLADNLKLDPHPDIPGREHGYAVFGRVIDGMAVVDRIATIRTGALGPFEQDAPLNTVVIEHARLLPRVAAQPSGLGP